MSIQLNRAGWKLIGLAIVLASSVVGVVSILAVVELLEIWSELA